MNLVKKVFVACVLSSSAAFFAGAMDKKPKDQPKKRSSSPLFYQCLSQNIYMQYRHFINQLADDSTRTDVIENLKECINQDTDFITHSHPSGMMPIIVYAAEKYAKFNWIVPIIASLLDAGADVNAIDKGGRTALHFASIANNLGLATLLLEYKADVNIQAKGSLYVPLHAACACGRKEFFEMLITAGADINACDKWGATPLHFAAGRGQEDAYGVYKVIFKKRCIGCFEDTECAGCKLYKAQIAARSYIIKTLLFLSAKINVQDIYGKSPLDYARENGHDELVAALSNQQLI